MTFNVQFNTLYEIIITANHLKMTGKGFYSKWVKSSFEQFITI